LLVLFAFATILCGE